jgi:putative transcriptional regulator
MDTRSLRTFLVALGCALAAAAAAPAARAADLSEPVMLVAKPELAEFYAHSVLFVRPVGDGRHIGLILNRPTPITLGKLFPEHAASAKVADPVYLGGPVATEGIFAMVHAAQSPGGRSLPLMAGLFLAVDGDVVDGIIETDPQHARFFAGFVVWQTGELEAEVEGGFWTLVDPDVQLMLRKSTDGLWEELTLRSRGAI